MGKERCLRFFLSFSNEWGEDEGNVDRDNSIIVEVL